MIRSIHAGTSDEFIESVGFTIFHKRGKTIMILWITNLLKNDFVKN